MVLTWLFCTNILYLDWSDSIYCTTMASPNDVTDNDLLSHEWVYLSNNSKKFNIKLHVVSVFQIQVV